MFPITRVYSDSHGDSHFEDVAVELKEAGSIGQLFAGFPVKGIMFHEVEHSYNWNFHRALQKQYSILLEGAIEIENSLDRKRTFKAGDVLLVANMSGKGYKIKNLQSIKRKSIFITLP